MYDHVELDRHDVLLAEVLAAESYFDTGNLHPDFPPATRRDAQCVCAVLDGARLANFMRCGSRCACSPAAAALRRFRVALRIDDLAWRTGR